LSIDLYTNKRFDFGYFKNAAVNKIVRIYFFSILICLMSACNRDGVDQNYGIDSEDIAFNKEYSDLAENPFVKVEAQTISIVSTDVEGAS